MFASVRVFALALLVVPLGASAVERLGPTEILRILQNENDLRIEWGELAQNRSDSVLVQHFGEMLVADHRRIDETLRVYARLNRIELGPPALRTPSPLRELGGREFEVGFAAAVRQSDGAIISFIVRTRETLRDAELRRLLSNVLSTYRDHERALDRLYRDELPSV